MSSHLLHDLVARSAERHPDHLAVADGERTLSYADLEHRSNQVARLLVDTGVQRGDRVALYLDKSLESVVGLYGILKAGGAYVPLDPHAPVGRLGYIAGDCAVRCVLSAVGKAASWPELLAAAPSATAVVVLDGAAPDAEPPGVPVLGSDAIDAQDATAPAARSIGFDLAYILYTSGSTGRPKGVMLTHHNALGFVDWAAEEFGVGPADRVSSHAPFHFDLSTFDLFAAAHGGAGVVLVPALTSVFPPRLRDFIDREGITVWYSVPSILSMLVLKGALQERQFPALRTILFAGEVFPTKHLRTLMQLLPHVRFANLYGPTETNVCTWYEVPPLPDDQDEPIPIGRPIPNDEAFVVQEDGKAADPGTPGELYVRGATVMHGYWGDEERTARTLVAHPFDPGQAGRCYRTGDLVRELEDGNLQFLGRRDAQIKSRGYRIELGDLEAAVYAHPSVTECAAIAVPDDIVTNRIKLFVVVRDGLAQRELLSFCGERVPKYMLPDSMEFHDALPKTSTGKIDRQALQALTSQLEEQP